MCVIQTGEKQEVQVKNRKRSLWASHPVSLALSSSTFGRVRGTEWQNGLMALKTVS